jgi:DNA-binding MarR family transcriptional regulator
MDHCFAGRVRYMSRAITSMYNEHFREHGMTAAQVTLLSSVDQFAPVGPSELAKMLSMEKSTVSRNLARMHQSGWIEIEAGEDERSRRVSMTRKGRGKLTKVFPSWVAAQDELEALIGSKGAESILESFRAVQAGSGTHDDS